jgi:tRNA uridine 5-carboxymethylaminomethyl modification enzyme
MAGINAALKVKGEAPLVLDRTEAYTAILIDDLISKGTNEPYRMFTSRAEFRLHLRIDNADRRLTPHGRRIGLVNDASWAQFMAKQERGQKLSAMLEKTKVSAELLEKVRRARAERLASPSGPGEEPGSTPEANLGSAVGSSLAQLLRRPEIVIEDYAPVIAESYPDFFAEIAVTSGDAVSTRLSSIARNEMKTIETEIKYSGYLDQQKKSIDRLKKSEQKLIPAWFDYSKVSGLSREMNEKLQLVRPGTLGQASRIPGVTPAAVSLINVFIEIQAKRFAHVRNLAVESR